MAQPYVPLDYLDRIFHIDTENGMPFANGVSGVLASGEANFADGNKWNNGKTFIPPTLIPDTINGIDILRPSGLTSRFSNGLYSLLATDTSIINLNPYIHYMPNPAGGIGQLDKSSYAFYINTVGFFNDGVYAFNIYNTQYRG